MGRMTRWGGGFNCSCSLAETRRLSMVSGNLKETDGVALRGSKCVVKRQEESDVTSRVSSFVPSL